MKRRIFKTIVAGATALLMLFALVGCDEISVVQYGSPYDYPDKEWGEVLDDTCKNCKWESFIDEDDDTIVEFNGIVKETNAKLCIQFEVDDNEFETVYMDIDGESCSEYEMIEVVTLLFE